MDVISGERSLSIPAERIGDNKTPLSDEERALVGPIAKRWKERVLSTEPLHDIDMAAVRRAVCDLYRCKGLEPPLRVVKVPSPLAGNVAANMASIAWWINDTEPEMAHQTEMSFSPDAVKKDLMTASFEGDKHRSFYVDYDARGKVVDYLTTTQEEFAKTGLNRAIKAATPSVSNSYYGANTSPHTAGKPEAHRHAPHMRFDDTPFFAALECVKQAIGANNDHKPAVRQWPNHDPDAYLRKLKRSMLGSYVLRMFVKNAAKDVGMTTEELLNMENPDLDAWPYWKPWAVPSTVQRHLGIKLCTVSHGLLLKTVRGGVVGQCDVSELPMLEFAHETRGHAISEAVQHSIRAACHGTYRWQHKRFCIVCDRPRLLRLDSHGRPHCTHGPSHQWSDGFSLYHLHGVEVPARFVEEPGTVTSQEAQEIEDTEVRRTVMRLIQKHHTD